MDLIKTSTCTLIFGDKTVACPAETMLQATNLRELNEHEALFHQAQQLFSTKTLILPLQTHKTDTLIITSPDALTNSLATITKADIVITTLPQIIVGVLTADCLPLLLVDPLKKAVAAVHAGWRGAVANIAGEAVKQLKKVAGSDPAMLQAYFGPCAHVESYPASPELLEALATCPFKNKVVKNYGNEIHFDIPQLTSYYLEAAGLIRQNIHKNYSIDTITHRDYWSYRREGEKAGRQLSAVCLKNRSGHVLNPGHIP